mmetsp:Transcript_9790/g.17701  ORF Transcript_9790/g.17701 Transcript_9790/m.17701 type:complete len:104 (+) Transcript_9790:139-450(+)
MRSQKFPCPHMLRLAGACMVRAEPRTPWHVTPLRDPYQAVGLILHTQILQEMMCDERQSWENRDVLVTMDIHPWDEVLLVDPMEGVQKERPYAARDADRSRNI